MRCCDVEALWDEMREGVPPRREHVLAHLRRCTTCQELYREFEGVAYCLSCLPVVEPPTGLVPKILEHIKTVRGPRYSIPDGLALMGSPIGKLYIAFRPSGITYLGIDRGEPLEDVRAHIERRLHRSVRAADAPAWVAERLSRYFTTWRTDADLLDLSDLTQFEQAAMRKTMEIPAGEVRSYSWIAREIGHPQAARAVGQAMARNPLALLVPCHRVVDAHGSLHHYGYGLDLKARILTMEGYAPAAAPHANRSAREVPQARVRTGRA